MSLLRFSEFTCWRSDEALFKPVNFSLSSGDIVQVVGPNGAGKTTLLRCLCGLYNDYQGDIFWQERSWQSRFYDFSHNLLYLGHTPGVKKSLTAAENLAWYTGIQQGLSARLQIEDALTQVGLEDYTDTICQEMSAGQLRRVALARLFISQRPLWVLDEPFTAIDVLGVSQLEQRLQNHVQQGGTVLLTTHQPLAIAQVKNLTLHPCRHEASYES
ncbi:MAG TPA: cytochrome c biogenesis heme-transporting ATPase CcmA [Cellvibrionaceae bacterium]|nr:cytochrome c biogenesis heme-transporting ATPase CcmA [Cellvibrionaceae bacterium]